MRNRCWAIWLFVTVVMLVACSNQSVQQASLTATPAATAVPTPTPTLKPTEGVPTPTATLPKPTTTSTPVVIAPVATAPAIRVDSWSPDGDWLAYWLAAEVPQFFYPFPPGKLHFLNIRTGQICSYSEYVARDHGDHLVWQLDGKVQVILSSDKRAYRGAPCRNDFVRITYRPEVKEINSALSPNGSYRASTVSRTEADGTLDAVTTITRVATGKVESTVKWKHRGGEGELGPGGQWLAESQFLVHETLDQGPLLITVGKGTVRVAQELFKVPPVTGKQGQSDFVILRAAAAVVNGTHTYHIVLFGMGMEAAFPPIRLYHSETGKVEEIPFRHTWTPAFSSDGQWLLLDERPIKGNYESYALWTRPVDPVGSEARALATSSLSDGSPYALWSANWKRVAFGFPGHIVVYTFPEGVRIGSWMTDAYGTVPRAWSPDGNLLAVEGYIPAEQQQALFVIRP